MPRSPWGAEAVLDDLDLTDGERLRGCVELAVKLGHRLELHRRVDRLRVPAAPVLKPVTRGDPGRVKPLEEPARHRPPCPAGPTPGSMPGGARARNRPRALAIRTPWGPAVLDDPSDPAADLLTIRPELRVGRGSEAMVAAVHQVLGLLVHRVLGPGGSPVSLVALAAGRARQRGKHGRETGWRGRRRVGCGLRRDASRWNGVSCSRVRQRGVVAARAAGGEVECALVIDPGLCRRLAGTEREL